MTYAIGLPGATEFVVILIVGALVLGIVVTTLLIARHRRSGANDPGPPPRDPAP